MSDGDLAARREVRDALSELYLDDDVAARHAHIAAVLAASPFPPDTLQRMLLHDVHPRLAPNLLSVAGVWQGFDSDGLSTAIQRREGVQRWPAWRTRGYPRQQWRLLLPQLLALRAAR
ncbi:hypothetical protein QSH18_01930 [Xanthomonas sp. NCPPB 2654]|uniref:DUF7079 family protein n=1 Tax=unclassified Xanthomonas TaxID=2643310 RepID=UPI0021DF482E|nr:MULTISPECIES: hypothetical protein [unclassified Xanthomonas]MDL5364358.1 hypothetical protein [Xanthomonas sp. NCPPB 2654]UYC20348.1 hypothetical protein NUG20_19725 [Xanthomonas sp. CFBP 8443]